MLESELEREDSSEEEAVMTSHEMLNTEPFGDDKENQASTENTPENSFSPVQTSSTIQPVDIHCNSFVCVKFTYTTKGKKETAKTFVAQITEMNESKNIYKVSCLRIYKEKRNVYIFPVVPDVVDIGLEQIVSLLPKPDIVRGRYIFDETLEFFG
mgnify:CR=1 FL=1